MAPAASNLCAGQQLARAPRSGIRPRIRLDARGRGNLVTERDHRFRQIAATALAALLFVSILLLWVPARWAATLFQTGVFALAIVWIVHSGRFRRSLVLIPLAGTVLWGLAQLA